MSLDIERRVSALLDRIEKDELSLLEFEDIQARIAYLRSLEE